MAIAQDVEFPGEVPPPEGEGKEGDPKEKDVVPKTQFLAAIKSANAKFDALKASFDALKVAADSKVATPAPDPAQARYTRAQLNAMQTAGQITQEQADAQMEFQMRADAAAEARRVTQETFGAQKRKGFVDTEIDRYKALAPEILDDEHETRQRIKEEYRFLVESMGDADSVETQLKAIRAVLGPVAKLELARSGADSHESHRETGGGGGPAPGTKKFEATLSARERTYYQKGIDSGRYKDWNEVKEELKYANRETRRKHGAAA